MTDPAAPDDTPSPAVTRVLHALAAEQHQNLCACVAYPDSCLSTSRYDQDGMLANLTYAEPALEEALKQGWIPPAETPDPADEAALDDVALAEIALAASLEYEALNPRDGVFSSYRAAVAAVRPHLTAEQAAEKKRLTGLIADLVYAAIGRYAFGESPESQAAPAVKAINAMCADDDERDAEVARLRESLRDLMTAIGLDPDAVLETDDAIRHAEKLRAEREVVLDLHQHRLLDEYSRETTDPSAARYGRCDTCGNVRDGVFCPTYLALAEPPAPTTEEAHRG